MKQETVNNMKNKLEQLRTEIIAILEDKNASSQSRDGRDSVDQTSDMLVEQMGSILSSNHKKNLAKVDEALSRIANGTYGKCDECGTDIPPKRLEILPFAALCVQCKTELENIG